MTAVGVASAQVMSWGWGAGTVSSGRGGDTSANPSTVRPWAGGVNTRATSSQSETLLVTTP